MNKTHLLVSGLLAGAALFEAMVILRMKKTCGTLQIDTKDKVDRYMFNIEDFDGLSKKKYVRLKVDSNADLSQH